jgi:hypothetical protein
MSEPEQILVEAASQVLGEVGTALRKRGWAVELSADRNEEGIYSVSLRYELPKMKIPVEAT